MVSWNLRENADFCTKIAPNLWWIPANSLRTSVEKMGEGIPHNLFELLTLFQAKNMKESFENRILRIDPKEQLIWEFFDTPEKVAMEYTEGNCAVFAIWLNYYLKKMFEKSGYIEMMRSTSTWHVLNYIKIKDMYYIIDPSVMIKKYKEKLPMEDGNYKTYAQANMITGGVLRTPDLKYYVSYYEKYVAIANLRCVFIRLDDYQLPAFCIEHKERGFGLYYPSEVDYTILNENYDKTLYYIGHMCIKHINELKIIREDDEVNIWKTAMKRRAMLQGRKS